MTQTQIEEVSEYFRSKDFMVGKIYPIYKKGNLKITIQGIDPRGYNGSEAIIEVVHKGIVFKNSLEIKRDYYTNNNNVELLLERLDSILKILSE